MEDISYAVVGVSAKCEMKGCSFFLPVGAKNLNLPSHKKQSDSFWNRSYMPLTANSSKEALKMPRNLRVNSGIEIV